MCRPSVVCSIHVPTKATARATIKKRETKREEEHFEDRKKKMSTRILRRSKEIFFLAAILVLLLDYLIATHFPLCKYVQMEIWGHFKVISICITYIDCVAVQ